jgi:hypothetical protein
LTLIDLSLAGNLLLIVIFSGFENFVSKMDVGEHEDKPAWMGKVDFGGLKLKLIASIAAISAIQLLKTFMNIHAADKRQTFWQVVVHLTFVASGVLLATMDWIAGKARALHGIPDIILAQPRGHYLQQSRCRGRYQVDLAWRNSRERVRTARVGIGAERLARASRGACSWLL